MLRASPTGWDEVAVALLAESALMEASGTPSEQVQAALAVLSAALPPETDAGVYYDNARRKAAVIRHLLKCPAAVGRPAIKLRLDNALEQAQYVGD
jgi:hypothetical protein